MVEGLLELKIPNFNSWINNIFNFLQQEEIEELSSTSTPPVEDKASSSSIPQAQLIPNLHALILAGVSVPFQAIFPRMEAPRPWGQRFGPLDLPQPLHELPRGNRKNFPKFRGD
ncbi:hypothetical protein KI387_010073, partial [Taxus chinensis]